jgi:murein DD-endopeptidase MepM/ murein hydrolase activator NlpD
MVAEYLAMMVELAAGLVRIVGLQALLAGVVFIPVLVLVRILRNGPPVLVQALWGLVLLRLVLPPDLASPVGLENLAGSAALQPVAEAVGLDLRPLLSSEPQEATAVPTMVTGAAASAVDWWPAVLGLTWLAGTLLVCVLLTRRRRAYRKLVQRATPVTEAGFLALQRRWCGELGIRRRVWLITSDESHAPFTYGTLRPVIFLPRALLEHGEPEVLESVLAHELAHVKRWDDALLLIQLAIATLYFFHPLAWLSVSRIRAAAERGCDELVLSRGQLAPKAYGRSILTVLRLGLVGGALAPALGIKARRVEMRLKAIMKRRSAAALRARTMLALPAAFCLALLLLPLASRPVVRAQVTVAASGAAQDSLVWVNPMPGARVTSRFGPARNPFTGKEAQHRGIDLAGSPGAGILAASSGVVEEATTDYSGGKDHGTVVILDHGNGIKSFYSHLDELRVNAGERVRAGAVLGTQGSTGKVTGPHLHFEIWVAGERRDPAQYITDLAG